mmetsp:Transcript_37243/g.57765  ORF Transcript_37243/g.57765 Transcript_37243/m.57765 type:complete len:345 (-) Transcript_37243:1514-2548(-)
MDQNVMLDSGYGCLSIIVILIRHLCILVVSCRVTVIVRMLLLLRVVRRLLSLLMMSLLLMPVLLLRSWRRLWMLIERVVLRLMLLLMPLLLGMLLIPLLLSLLSSPTLLIPHRFFVASALLGRVLFCGLSTLHFFLLLPVPSSLLLSIAPLLFRSVMFSPSSFLFHEASSRIFRLSSLPLCSFMLLLSPELLLPSELFLLCTDLFNTPELFLTSSQFFLLPQLLLPCPDLFLPHFLLCSLKSLLPLHFLLPCALVFGRRSTCSRHCKRALRGLEIGASLQHLFSSGLELTSFHTCRVNTRAMTDGTQLFHGELLRSVFWGLLRRSCSCRRLCWRNWFCRSRRLT